MWPINGIKSAVNRLVTPKSPDRELARREYILNILLTGSILLTGAGFVENIVYHSFLTLNHTYTGINPLITFVFVLFLCYLLFLSKRGKIYVTSIILIGFLLLSSLYTSYKWGADIPQSLLMYSLIIVMSGILISTRFAFITASTIILSLLAMSFSQVNSLHHPDLSWRRQPSTFGDTLVRVVTLLVITLISWLFNKEMEKTLRRARISEQALRKQRDQLEVMVERRTKQLEQEQAEKMVQLYRFAQFGRISSGLFHDLANPLNLVSINLNRLKGQNSSLEKDQIDDAKVLLQRAISGTERLENFVTAARKQIQNRVIKENFSANDEIKESIQMMEYKSRKSQVKISFINQGKVSIFGNSVRFSQLITNLISNAVDAYQGSKKKDRKVEITLEDEGDFVKLTVQDWGIGIEEDHLSRIFEPLFTTKKADQGMGLGLSLCREIVEDEMRGSILVESKKGVGSKFIVEIPKERRKIAV